MTRRMSSTLPKPDAGNEITSEMIAAGCAVLDDYDARFEADFEIVARIFKAMSAREFASGRRTGRPNRSDNT